jgi:hypothetical protein
MLLMCSDLASLSSDALPTCGTILVQPPPPFYPTILELSSPHIKYFTVMGKYLSWSVRVSFMLDVIVFVAYYSKVLQLIYLTSNMTSRQTKHTRHLAFESVYMAGKQPNSRWNVLCQDGIIQSITECSETQGSGERFLSPSLCHPHIHLDKCFLLSHPKYADLEIRNGDFAEAMKLTSR